MRGFSETRAREHNFEEHFGPYDVVLLTETHVSTEAELNYIPGFVPFALPKPTRSAKAGVACFLNMRLVQHAQVWRAMQEYGLLCLRFDAALFTTGLPLFLILCYIPPLNSKRMTVELAADHFSALQLLITETAVLGDVLCAGDFNARTGEGMDYLEDTDTTIRVDGVSWSSGQPDFPKRHNQDRVTNPHGRRLLDLCKSCNMLILNGRCDGDQHGAFTFASQNGSEGRSLVDYFLAPPHFLPHVQSLRICPPFTPGFAFDHSPVLLDLNVLASVDANTSDAEPAFRSLRWDANKADAYAEALDSAPIQHLLTRMSSQIQQDVISTDAAAEMLTRAILDAAALAGFKFSGSGGAKNKSFPLSPWFDAECRTLRAALLRSRKADPHSAACRQLQRQFKTMIRRKRRAFIQKRDETLMRERHKDPASFWKKCTPPHLPSALLGRTTEVQAHFAKLLSAAPHSSDTLPRIAPAPVSSNTRAAARPLNTDIADSEVSAALGKLSAGKAAGLDGIPVEFLKYARRTVPNGTGGTRKEYILLPYLVGLFNLIFSRGLSAFPTVWSRGVITPIHKKGNTENLDNYRGITVGVAFAKLYATVLDARITRWAEASGVRAVGQAGFRENYRTTDHIFILRHLVDKYRAPHRQGGCATPLYTCFVDLKQAFDSVPRTLLWERLRMLGVHGKMFDALRSMYEHVNCCVKLGHDLTDFFPSYIGVKQGCPLSPNLFGLYIDALEGWLQRRVPREGAALGQLILQLLLFADDLVLFSESAAGLQRLLNALADFCKEWQLTINCAKTEVVVFRNAKTRIMVPSQGFFIDGSVLKIADHYKYLGVCFHSTRGASFSVDSLAAIGTKALFAFHKRCADLNLNQNIPLQLHMFGALVKPILSYACEVWCPTVARRADLDNSLERIQLSFAHSLLRLRSTTANAVVLRELGLSSLAYFWWLQTGKFWNRLCRLPGTRLVGAAFRENLNLRHFPGSWTAEVLKRLANLGMPDGVPNLESPAPLLPLEDLSKALTAHELAAWQQLPNSPREIADSDHAGIKLCTYARWFDADTEAQLPALCSEFFSQYNLLRTLCRFRCGNHRLAIETGRWAGVLRSQRVCPLCTRLGVTVVEDQQHFTLECPAYSHIRGRYSEQLTDWDDMRTFFGQSNRLGVANFVADCLSHRQNVLDAPV